MASRSDFRCILPSSLACIFALLVCLSAPRPATSDGQQVSMTYDEDAGRIRQLIADRLSATWAEFSVRPARTATDGEWVRRTFLDVIGRTPTAKESSSFVRQRGTDKRIQLINELLDGEAYADEYVRHWSIVWSNVLIGRSGGQQRGSRVNRAGMAEYLSGAFAENRSYRTMVRELITATGSNTEGRPAYNGAVNFLTDKLEDRAIQATARTAQIFAGMQIQCTQCHNHPFNEWKQNQFWELNSFFRQTVSLRRNSRSTNGPVYFELADQDFQGEGSTPESAEVYFEQRNGRLKVAYPVFLDGTALPQRSGYLEDVNRRAEFCRMLVESPMLSRAVVNRYWSYFFGFGLATPFDDMGPQNPTPHQELMDELSAEFVGHNYDLKQLIRWMVLSRPYGLSSRNNANSKNDTPDAGTQPLFSRFYMRPMQPETLYRSLVVLSYDRPDADSFRKHQPTQSDWLAQFVQALDNDEGTESISFDGTISQTLMMFNGPLIQAATAPRDGSFIGAVIGDTNLDLDAKVDRLFWAAFARPSTKKERRLAVDLIQARYADRSKKTRRNRQRTPNGTENAATSATQSGLVDLWWALLNSNEFVLIH